MKNDLTGKRFGRLTAKFVCGKLKDRHYLWHCVCDCGNEVIVPSNGLTCGPLNRVVVCKEIKQVRQGQSTEQVEITEKLKDYTVFGFQ